MTAKELKAEEDKGAKERVSQHGALTLYAHPLAAYISRAEHGGQHHIRANIQFAFASTKQTPPAPNQSTMKFFVVSCQPHTLCLFKHSSPTSSALPLIVPHSYLSFLFRARLSLPCSPSPRPCPLPSTTLPQLWCPPTPRPTTPH